jgi:RNase P subunit RPR2
MKPPFRSPFFRAPGCAEARRRKAKVIPLYSYIAVVCPRCGRIRYFPRGAETNPDGTPRRCDRC